MTEFNESLLALDNELISGVDVARALEDFDTVQDALLPREQIRVTALLLKHVEHDGRVPTGASH